MIARLMAWSSRHARLVLAVTAAVALLGERARESVRRDLVPDLSYPQIAVAVQWRGHAATQVADSVTRVVTTALEGISGAETVRGSSMPGMAYVDVVFRTASELSQGRAQIVERLAKLGATLPPDARVRIGPEASSVGWVLQYALAGPEMHDPMDSFADLATPTSMVSIRRLQTDVLGPTLAAIPGVAEVATLGGEEEERLVELKPELLRGAGVAVSTVVSALRSGLEGPARLDPNDIGSWPLPTPSDTAGPRRPLRVADVARVRAAGQMSDGIADLDGHLPAVGGIVIAKADADVPKVIEQVKVALERQRRALPKGVSLSVVYDRSELIARVERTWLLALAEEVAAVVIVALLFLLHGPSALLSAITLPVVILLTFVGMWLGGVSATVMSVGGIGIALGMAVDADLVAVEACHRRLETLSAAASARERRERLVAAAGSLAPAILTSLAIAALTFAPVFAFGGETGRLLRPLAFTKILVIAAAALVSLTVAPVLRARLLAGPLPPEDGNRLMKALVGAYRPMVHFVLRHPLSTLATATLAVLSCLPIVTRLGAEFLPHLDEGDLLFMPTTSASVKMTGMGPSLVLQDRALRARGEVSMVFGKVGRADTATDPAGASMAETIVRLKPRSEWPRPEASRAEVIGHLDRAARFPGWTNDWTSPVRARMDMMSTEVHTPVAIRVVTADPARLDELGVPLEAFARALPGVRSAAYESSGAERRVRFIPDGAALARSGADEHLVHSLSDLLASGGEVGSFVRGGQPVRVRLIPDIGSRSPEEGLRGATVEAPSGTGGGARPIPLALLGRVVDVPRPASVRTEGGRFYAYVYVDVSDEADVLRFVDGAQNALAALIARGGLRLRGDERIEWAGQYRPLVAGQRRLMIIVPIVLVSMLGLLFLQFRSFVEPLIVMASVPFALVGSFWMLFLFNYKISAPVWVGLLSTFGLAMQTGVVMVVYIDEAFHRRVREGRLSSRDDIIAAHAEGTIRRLRPKIMTVATMAAGLLPLLWSRGAGAEMMARVAAPMVGGLASSSFLTLEVIPVLYTIWRQRQLARAQRTGVPVAEIVGPPPRWARG
jgi:Cu(I)/Ag(I) efflux system membrane protein CusA/SilA